MMNRQVIV